MIPALKGRATVAPTLRVEDLIRSSFSLWRRPQAQTKVYATSMKVMRRHCRDLERKRANRFRFH
jgi:hypothetical protein